MTIGDLLRELPADKDSIKENLDLTEHEFNKLRSEARERGVEVFYDRSDKVYKTNISIEPTKNDLEDSVIQYLEERGIQNEEAKKLLKNIDKPSFKGYRTTELDHPEQRFKYLAISDTHMGHKMYRPDVLEHAIETALRENVDFFVHSGDILEGMSGRAGHIYELTHLGATAQLDYAQEELSKITEHFPLYAIIAENSHDGWFNNKGNTGLDVGQELERRIDGFTFMGHDEADLELSNGATIRLRHPGGGTAYAVSYKMQKYLLALDDNDKPDIVHQGHYHKLNYLRYRGIHAFDAGALQEQTIFMKKKESPSMLAYTVMDVGMKNGEVVSVRPEFFTFEKQGVIKTKI